MRRHRSVLLVSAGLCTMVPALLAHGAGASVPPVGLVIPLDDPIPMLSYDMEGLADGGLAVTAPSPIAAPRPVAMTNADSRDLECLSNAVYFEARSEPRDGQRAVAQVVLNRVGRRGFPASVCGVVYQGAGAQGGHGCQFNFVCDGSMAARRERGAWATARRIARAVIDGDILASLRGVTSFHTRAVKPDWSSRMERVATIGSHIFYRSTRA